MQKGNKEKQNTPVLTTKKKKNPKTLLIQLKSLAILTPLVPPSSSPSEEPVSQIWGNLYPKFGDHSKFFTVCILGLPSDKSPKYSLEGLMLTLKLQYFDHLMRRTDSLETTLMLGKIEGGRRRGQQRMK